MNGNTKADTAIELLLIERSLNVAEEKISALKNAHLAIHATSVTNETALFESLDEKKHDIILCCADHEDFELNSTIAICKKTSPDTPIIVMYNDQPQEKLISALRGGARDFVKADNTEHLELVVRREFSDLTMRRDLQMLKSKLHESEMRCTSLIESSQNAIAYVHEGMHVHANPTYLEMFGYLDLDEIEGMPILDMISKDEHRRFKAFLRSLGDDNKQLEIQCQTSNGKAFAAKLEFSPATIDGEPCTQIVIRDQSSQKDLEEQLAQLSSLDSQTGLANRQYLMQEMDNRIAAAKNGENKCSLFFIVADNFQEVRNEIGVAASDTLLQQIANALSEMIEEHELLARFGDHTFTILSEKSSDIDAEPLAELIRTTIDELEFVNNEQLIHVTASIGFSYLDEETETSQEFINQAYRAYEAAKNAGGNQYALFDATEMMASYGEDQTADAGDDENLTELIRHALEQDQFRLVYQPVVSLQGDTRENYAVLLRLLDNNGDELLPDSFMKFAVASGQMADIDRWVVRHAIEKLAFERQQGKKVNFFVTLSHAALEDDGLLLWICDSLRDYKAKGAWLTFQIKDIDLRAHTRSAKHLIDGLKKIKCQIAIDQFGTNPKPDVLLKHMQADYVKFERSLMIDLAVRQEKQDRLNELTSIAHSYEVKTIATGVEDANSLAILWTVGVNYTQGYFLQEPSPDISYDFNSV